MSVAKQKAKAAKKKIAPAANARKKKAVAKPTSPSKKKVATKSAPKKPAQKPKAKPLKAAATKKKPIKATAKPAAKASKPIKAAKVQSPKAPAPKAKAVVKAPVKAPTPKSAPTPKIISVKTAITPKSAPIVVTPPPPPEKKTKPEAAKKPTPKASTKPAAGAVRKVINLDEIKLPSGYKPSPNEEYMSPQHLAYFKQKLQNWRQELILESQETLEHLRTETRDVGDEAERASRESDNILELRTRDRYRKLLNKIEQALKRIEEGNYGYCEETGEEIGLGRLEARPIATLTVDAQERRELLQRQFRDDH
jgi:DnaK suppressor protein